MLPNYWALLSAPSAVAFESTAARFPVSLWLCYHGKICCIGHAVSGPERKKSRSKFADHKGSSKFAPAFDITPYGTFRVPRGNFIENGKTMGHYFSISEATASSSRGWSPSFMKRLRISHLSWAMALSVKRTMRSYSSGETYGVQRRNLAILIRSS